MLSPNSKRMFSYNLLRLVLETSMPFPIYNGGKDISGIHAAKVDSQMKTEI